MTHLCTPPNVLGILERNQLQVVIEMDISGVGPVPAFEILESKGRIIRFW